MSAAPDVRRRAGYAYVEVLISVGIVALILAPALDAVWAGISAVRLQGQLTSDQHHLTSRMEEVLAEPFDDLDAEAQRVADPGVPTAYSDAVATPRRRLVYLSRYDGDDDDGDGDGFTGTDENLLWIRVEIENVNRGFETLRVR